MSTALVGANANAEVERACKIVGITITPAAGVDATLSIYGGKDTTASAPLVMRASGNTTSQFLFLPGLPYHNGFVIVPANTNSFVVEYEPL